MKKILMFIICMFLVVTLLVPTLTFAQGNLTTGNSSIDTSENIMQKKYLSQNINDRISEKRADVAIVANEIIQHKTGVNSILVDIKKQLANLGSIGKILNDAQYNELKTTIENALNSFKQLNKNANIKQNFEEFKNQNGAGNTGNAENTLDTIFERQQERIESIKAMKTKLEATLEQVKSFVANNQVKIKEAKANKVAVENSKKAIQANHLEIVKAENEFRQVMNKIVATISANKDVFTDEKLTQLETVLVELKALKNELHNKLKNGVKLAIQTANRLRNEGKYTEVKVALENAIQLQNAKKLALGEAKVKAENILSDINAIIDATTVPISSQE